MTTFSERITLAVPIEQVWAALADYGQPHHYFESIVDAHIIGDRERGIGAMRHCDLPGRGNNFIVEEITEWNDGASFTYRVTDTNAPIENGSVVWSVRPVEGGAQVEARVQYEPKYGVAGKLMDVAVMNRQFRTSIAEGLASFKRRLESELTGGLLPDATAA